MRLIIPAMLLLNTLPAVDAGIDAVAFGASHHSNRDYPWREFNPGGGVSPFLQWQSGAEVFLTTGQYKNSTGGNSFLQMFGARYVRDFGDWTVGAWGAYGVIEGYAGQAVRPMAGVSLGWRWVYLDGAYKPATPNDDGIPETSVVCAWIRLRAWRF